MAGSVAATGRSSLRSAREVLLGMESQSHRECSERKSSEAAARAIAGLPGNDSSTHAFAPIERRYVGQIVGWG